MSKKSRRRNRRLLMMAALAGGAALAGRGKGAVSTVGQPTGTERVAHKPAHLGLGETVHAPAVKNVIRPTPPVVKKPVDHSFQTRFTARGDDGTWKGPGQLIAERRLTAGNKVPPSMRGGAETAQGFVRKVPISRTGRGRAGVNYGWTTQPYKKGGRVTGIAKRGFGRALMKGKK